MNSNYGKSNNKAGSINSFDFDLGLGSGRSKPMKDQTSSYAATTYSQKPNAGQQPNKSSWTHQPAAPVQSGGLGSLSGSSSMVGDIFGKSWNSAAPASGVGIVQNKNPNLFGDLLNSAMGHNKGSNNVPLKNAARPGSQSTFSMGGVADSLPKSGISTQTTGSWGSNASNNSGNVNFGSNYNTSSNLGGGNVKLGGNNNRNPSLGDSSMKSMAGGNNGGGGIGSNKDPFGSFVDFGAKKPDVINSARSDKSGLKNNLFGEFQNPTSQTSGSQFSSDPFSTSKNDPIGDFGFVNIQIQSQSQPASKFSGASDFDTLFSSTSNGGLRGNERFASQQLSGDDDWGINAEFEGGADVGGTTELEGLPPPPAGVTAPSAKNKGMDNYKQGQYADAIKWLSWAVILFEKAGDNDGTMEVLTCRASCYKEVGEYKKAVADCTKVLEHDHTNVSVLVQRSLLYESMEKYKLGAEDLRTVMKLDPGNRVARSTIHRLTKMAG